ncbi:MAG: AAA family ATPase [Bacteroidetes bacterium GWF2_42_66]|nr:MAG: AAA family ATPase [Bacteroidetes bacterium GWA2_42_15]OFX96291.1 MAG: AAA family ATPase [Bacteroidetes bacterium GWE2_42_39]OFY46330.1 MAG: AAA family ATPase [Bacteroidetes bacterium GWF2_42_66]HAZ03447.1 AAA family ATPase [Marinilabiliales bacterium]HBL78287.1 AAA family ATPase [Prolixibacteraceae bacterium]
MILRKAENEIRVLATQFKAVAVVGPRQSGKTTLVRSVFSQKPYVNLENPDIRRYALEDPRGFLSNYPFGAILDEVQRVPELFSYLQQILDESVSNGLFIITGSNNFLLQESISQSLAGRVGYLYLLPLSLGEIGDKESNSNMLLFKGGYPALYNEVTDPTKWYANYILTYVERDVRLLKNITDLVTFERFLRLCAGRIGQLLNMSSLAVEVGIDVKTVGSWISVLETSFILFRLQPYFENYNKRVVKMPKLYFYDTGLAVALLGVENAQQLALHPFRGSLFENMIITDFLKRRYNSGKSNNLFFWRDNVGNEIDLLLAKGNTRMPVEIKSGQTVTSEYLKGIQFWNKMTQTEGGFVVYGGDMIQKRGNGITVVPFNEMDTISADGA